MSQARLDFEPQVVHFNGHGRGTGEDGLALEDETANVGCL